MAAAEFQSEPPQMNTFRRNQALPTSQHSPYDWGVSEKRMPPKSMGFSSFPHSYSIFSSLSWPFWFAAIFRSMHLRGLAVVHCRFIHA